MRLFVFFLLALAILLGCMSVVVTTSGRDVDIEDSDTLLKSNRAIRDSRILSSGDKPKEKAE